MSVACSTTNALASKRNKSDPVETECKVCLSKFVVDVDDVRYMKTYEVDGDEYKLTSYDCPTCGKRWFVQADDSNTKCMLDYATSLMHKAMKVKSKKALKVKFDKVSENLRADREKLKQKVKGKMATDAFGAEYELEFKND